MADVADIEGENAERIASILGIEAKKVNYVMLGYGDNFSPDIAPKKNFWDVTVCSDQIDPVTEKRNILLTYLAYFYDSEDKPGVTALFNDTENGVFENREPVSPAGIKLALGATVLRLDDKKVTRLHKPPGAESYQEMQLKSPQYDGMGFLIELVRDTIFEIVKHDVPHLAKPFGFDARDPLALADARL